VAHEFKRKLEYVDLEVTPDDGRRYELVDGELYVTPSPRPTHQRISGRLYLLFVEYFGGRSIGEVFYAPVDVILTRWDVFVPDLLVVSDPTDISERGIERPPLLVVEIASPSTRRHDRQVKARRYAELGVLHYWIVDADERRVDCYRLSSGAFEPVASEEGTATLRHPDWDGLAVDLGALWR
jgi:Uma2 family endonuclease